MDDVPQGFELIREDGPCWIVVKPGGLLTQAPPGIDSLEQRIKTFIKVRDAKPGRVYLGVPHRLDRPVSGIMVFARHVRAARRLSEQFQTRTVRKSYLALVEGQLEEDQGTWHDYLRKIPNRAAAEVVPTEHPEGREAVLHFQVLKRLADRSFLRIELETGRNHQIRVQAASRGFPIVGDLQYGASEGFGPPPETERDRLIALHAFSLRFRHPMTREVVEVSAPLPGAWEATGLAAPDDESA